MMKRILFQLIPEEEHDRQKDEKSNRKVKHQRMQPSGYLHQCRQFNPISRKE